MWVLSSVCVCVFTCVGESRNQDAGREDGLGGGYEPNGIHVSIPACIYPLCLLQVIIINADSQGRDVSSENFV